MTICLFPYCNGEAKIPIMIYYFENNHTRKPFARAILHVCEKHAIMLSEPELYVKIKRKN
ncbi:MAG: hypothetical protein V3T63_00250 [Nitrosopumilaceae archaeon]|jgi:hypothetical protein